MLCAVLIVMVYLFISIPLQCYKGYLQNLFVMHRKGRVIVFKILFTADNYDVFYPLIIFDRWHDKQSSTVARKDKHSRQILASKLKLNILILNFIELIKLLIERFIESIPDIWSS